MSTNLQDDTTESLTTANVITIPLETPDGAPDYGDAVLDQLAHFSSLDDGEKIQLILLAVSGLASMATVDTDAKKVKVTAAAAATKQKLKFRAALIVIGVICVNITAVVTTVLVVGVRNGSLPEISPITQLINLAVEILKTVFAA